MLAKWRSALARILADIIPNKCYPDRRHSSEFLSVYRLDCFNQSRSAPDLNGESINPLSGNLHCLLVGLRLDLTALYDAVRRVQ